MKKHRLYVYEVDNLAAICYSVDKVNEWPPDRDTTIGCQCLPSFAQPESIHPGEIWEITTTDEGIWVDSGEHPPRLLAEAAPLGPIDYRQKHPLQ